MRMAPLRRRVTGAEAQAVKSVFGADAHSVLVSSTKSMTGHLLGAAGAIESIFTVLALRDQAVPPTINTDNPDEGCDLDFVPHEARQSAIWSSPCVTPSASAAPTAR